MIIVSQGGEYYGETYISCPRDECKTPIDEYGNKYRGCYFEGESLEELLTFIEEHKNH